MSDTIWSDMGWALLDLYVMWAALFVPIMLGMMWWEARNEHPSR